MLKQKQVQIAGVVLAVGLLGVGIFHYSQAASGFLSLDVEKGTISGPALVIDDPSAGSSQAVRFGSGTAVPTPAPVPAPQPSPAPGPGTFGVPLYTEPAPGNTAKQYLLNRPTAAGAAQIRYMADQPIAKWFGAWNGDVKAAANEYVSAAQAAGALPMLVLYNIPSRDCGGFSAGGAQTEADYSTWVNQLAAGVNGRPAIYIIEPDAVSLIDCLNSEQLAARWRELSGAVKAVTAKGNAYSYLDAGHADWVSAGDTASRLQQAGVAGATGFALNVSNYTTTDKNLSFGNDVAGRLGNKHYVIDTSRNGNGPTADNQWCNPPGRALGKAPTTATGGPLADAYLWIKTPWASDGSCNGGPAAGEDNWPYAIDLAKAAGH